MPADWADAMAQGLASMRADNARIVVTVNFVDTVAELTGNPSYTAERGGGAVAARTVTGPGGSVVVVNHNELSSRPLADIQRLLAHEAGHILIDARGSEETSGHRDSNESDWQWWLKCLGAQAIVEFRIERSLADLGYPPGESAAATAVDHSLLITNAEVVNAVLDPASADPAHLRDALLTTSEPRDEDACLHRRTTHGGPDWLLTVTAIRRRPNELGGLHRSNLAAAHRSLDPDTTGGRADPCRGMANDLA